MESYSLVTGGVSLANKRNRFPRGGQAAVGVTARKDRERKRHAQALVMEKIGGVDRAGSPYLFYMPTGTPGMVQEGTEIDTYFVPRKKWESDVDSAKERQDRRISTCKNYHHPIGETQNERLQFIVRVFARHAHEKRLQEEQFAAALRELGMTNHLFNGKVFHHMAQSSGGSHIETEALFEVLQAYVSSNDMVECSDGKKRERWRVTVRSCYDLFDPPEGVWGDGKQEGCIAVRDMKCQRGLSQHRMDMGDPTQITFAMGKAILELAAGLPTRSQGLQQIIELADIEEAWANGGVDGGGDPGLVQGFLEEVFRIILVDKYKQTRKLLYK